MSEPTAPSGVASSPALAEPPAAPAPAASARLAEALRSLAAPAEGPEAAARARIAALEREARALGQEPAAALLFHEAGLLWEGPLGNARNAAVAFQNAYRLAPTLVPNLRAARRLFADVGNWQMVAQLLEAELAVVTGARERAALLFERGCVLEERLGREAEAWALFAQSLELAPADAPLLTQLAARAAVRGDAGALAQAYRLLARAVDAGELRAHYLTQAALVREAQPGGEAEAHALLAEAFALERKDPLLLSALERSAERVEDGDLLREVLQAEAELLGEQGAATWLQLAKVHALAGDRPRALEALLAARRVGPRDPLVLSALAGIFEGEGRHEELASVLLDWADAVTDEAELVALNLRLGALYEEQLGRDADAAARYEAILVRVPGHAAALGALGRLHHRTQRWEALLGVFEREEAAAEDPAQKAAKGYKAGEVLEERLGRKDEAARRYAACLQLQPGYLPAHKALARLYEKDGRYAELAALYEQDLLQTTDREQQISTLHRLAVLFEERLGDTERAAECLRRVLELAPEHLPTVRELGRLYERSGQHRALVDVLEREAALAGDTQQVLTLHHRVAELLDEQLQDRAGAVAAWERLLTLSPSYLPALRALGRLYAQDARWADLIRMYRAEAEAAASTEAAAALIFKTGELYERRLADENEAIACYQEVLTLAPSHFPALRALGRLHRAHGAWESLVEVLRAEAASRTDPLERANALYEAAAIWEDALGREDMAVEAYQEVLRLTPAHAAAMRALERLAAARDDVKALVAVLDRQTQVAATPALKVTAYLKLARVYLERLAEPARAAQCCEAALALEPGQLAALTLLERIRAADPARRAELRTRLAERVAEPRLAAALRLAAAADGARPGEPTELAALQRAFEEDPTDARLSFALERALRQAGDRAALGALYARLLELPEPPAERAALLLRSAELAEAGDATLEHAADLYRLALELQPGCLPALQGARRVAARRGDAAQVRAALEGEARASRDVRGAIDALVAAARLAADVQEDPDAAAALYRQALERDPLDAAAGEGLEALLTRRGSADELVALHTRRAEARLAQRELPEAAQAFVAAAHAALPGAREQALALLTRALSAQPDHAEALALQGRLALEAGRHAEAAQALARRVQQGGEPGALAELHLTLGRLYQDHLGDPGRAAAHLGTALAALPAHPEALERLATLHTRAGNWAGALDGLTRLLALELPEEARARHALALARVHDEGLQDLAAAAPLYLEALTLAPGEPEALERCIQLHERLGRLAPLAEVLEAQAARPRAPVLALCTKLGELYAGPLADKDRAVAAYSRALAAAPEDVPARAALAALHARDPATHALAVEEHRQLLRQDPARVDSLRALLRLWEAGGQPDRAFCAAAALVFLRAATEAETAFYQEARGRLALEARGSLSPADVEAVLLPPAARGPVLEVLRAVGDQLERLYPPQLELLGVDRKADRLKPDHALFKAVRSAADVLGAGEFEAFAARRGLLALETGEPLVVCVGQELVRRFNVREQRFLVGRVAMGLLNKAAVLARLSRGEVADLVGHAVRVHVPEWTGLGRRNDEAVKQLRRAASRRALKQLEPAAQALAARPRVDLDAVLDGLSLAADRAGLLLAADVALGLGVVLREDAAPGGGKPESAEAVAQAVREQPTLGALVGFALSDAFFRLRAQLGLAVGPA